MNIRMLYIFEYSRWQPSYEVQFVDLQSSLCAQLSIGLCLMNSTRLINLGVLSSLGTSDIALDAEIS